MNLDLNSLTEAVEQLWRAAISVSAIKYIAAGLVNNQCSGISINTEARKAQLLDQNTHDKKSENIINKLAAEITITIKENKNENDDKDNTIEDGMDDMVQTDDDLSPSSVCHRVTSPDTESDYKDHHQTISMISHTNDEPETSEQGDWASFQVHQCQDQHLEPACTNNHDLIMSHAEPGEIFLEAESIGGNPNIDLDYETQTVDESFDQSLNNTFEEEDEIDIKSDFLHCSTPEPIEEDEHFFTSFVSHQLPFLAPQDEYPTFITSSAAHTCLVLEDDFTDPQTSIISHYRKNSLFDSGIFEDVNEDMQELTEDVIDEYTEYTNDENLETIIEVSEICGESEMTEDFQISLDKNDADNHILRSMTQESIADIESEILELESLISRDFSSTSINIGEIDEKGMEEEIETQTVTEEDKEILSNYAINISNNDEDLYPSMVSHFVLENEMDPQKLPSAASHVVIGLSEENDFNSMITHSPDLCEDLSKPETTEEYSEYTEVEHLDTIMEVSEMIDESEMTEETEEIPISVDGYDMQVLRSMTQDSIADLQEEDDEDEEPSSDNQSHLKIIEEETKPDYSIITEEIVEENEDLQLAQEEELLLVPSIINTEYDESIEDFLPSMVSHCVVDNELEYDKLPSTAAHSVLGVAEENDYNSMLAHSHNFYGNPEFSLHQYYDISLAQEEHTNNVRYSRYGLLSDVCEENISKFGVEEFHSFYPRVENVEIRKNSMHEESLAPMSSDTVTNSGLSEDYNEAPMIASMEPDVTSYKANDSIPDVDEEVVEDRDSMLPQLDKNSCPEKVEESAAEKSEPEPVVQSFKLQLTRLQQLQKLVEDELEEFDQRKNKVDVEQATETQVINVVKGVEFITNIQINQVLEDSIHEPKTNKEEPIEPVPEEQEEEEEQDTTESIDTHEEKHNYEVFSEEEEAPEENFIHASCTLTDNSVSIKSNYVNTSHSSVKEEIKEENIPEDQKQANILQGYDNNDENSTDMTQQKQDELKLQLRVPQRKSLSSETKIRDKQLLDSLFSGSNKAENVALNEKTEESKEPTTRPSILKPSKSTVKIATATLNENVKKQSYRIKFKVKLNDNNSKKQTSVLRYLFGCFGGEKLFNSQHK